MDRVGLPLTSPNHDRQPPAPGAKLPRRIPRSPRLVARPRYRAMASHSAKRSESGCVSPRSAAAYAELTPLG
jgi:hypothetical protein